MTEEHVQALLTEAGAKKGAEGWFQLPEGRHMTLYISGPGAGMSVSRISALNLSGPLVRARTVKDEVFVFLRENVYAGSVEAPAQTARKAGFL